MCCRKECLASCPTSHPHFRHDITLSCGSSSRRGGYNIDPGKLQWLLVIFVVIGEFVCQFGGIFYSLEVRTQSLQQGRAIFFLVAMAAMAVAILTWVDIGVSIFLPEYFP